MPVTQAVNVVLVGSGEYTEILDPNPLYQFDSSNSVEYHTIA